MDEDFSRFCSACGAPLSDSDTFCTRCGKNYVAGTSYTGQTQHDRFGFDELRSNILIIVATFTAIWAIFALAFGIYFIVRADYLVTLLDQNELDLIASIGYTTFFFIIGTLIILSGAFAFITVVLCVLKKYYFIALAACIISALFGLIMIVGVMGFLVAFLIYRSKHEFKIAKGNVL